MLLYLKSNLKLLRKQRGVTQEELALQLGKVRTTINNWEKGVSVPNLEEIDKMTILFDVSGEDFLFRDLSNVQISEIKKGQKKDGNVQGNVQESVQAMSENEHSPSKTDTLLKANESALKEALKTNDILGIAIKGLEAANTRLIKELDEKDGEIKLLKREIPTVGEQLENNPAKAAG